MPLTSRRPLMPASDPALPSHIVFVEQGWLNCNVVAIRGDINILIDAGYCSDADELERSLWINAGLTFEQIGMLLITHAHPDHIGAAALIRSRSGAEIAADEETAGIVNQWDTRRLWSS